MALKNVFRVIVDYGKSLAEMKKAGSFDLIELDISVPHFPIIGSGTAVLDIELITYAFKYMSFYDMLQDLEGRGLRSVILQELLAFGATNPDLQRKYPICCLGSIWESRHTGHRYVPYLNNYGCLGKSERSLLLHDLDLFPPFGNDSRFAAVRKQDFVD